MQKYMNKDKATPRGLKKYSFKDSYGLGCSLQESSNVVPHIWLGANNPLIMISYDNGKKLGLDVKKPSEECNGFVMCNYPLPKEVMTFSRMHLNQEQAKELGEKLLEFAKKGKL